MECNLILRCVLLTDLFICLSIKIAKSGSELKNITEADTSVEDSLRHANDKLDRESALPCVQIQMVFTAFLIRKQAVPSTAHRKGHRLCSRPLKH